MKEMKKDDLREKCVICHKKLNIEKKTPINEREYYIEGAGQLCVDCFYKIHIKGGYHGR